MVFIKKIELQGFKSFPKKTSLSFGKDVNVIIGPNGSGKSNIIDAIQFVLGELSSRSLRANSFPQLLFYGSKDGKIPKAKHAVVSIELDNTDRQMPLPTDIVTISRYVGPDGVSTYRVNGKRFSRGALIDILGMVGLTGGGNIIAQGTTMQIARLSPEERRKSIENAVGIADYDRKKAEAQKNLNEADLNLRVAQANYNSVWERFIELERQRNDVLRFNLVKKELSQFSAQRLSFEITDLQGKLSRSTTDLEKATQRQRELKGESEQLDSRRHQTEREWKEYSEKVVDRGDDKLLQLQVKLGDINSEIAALKSSIASSRGSINSYEKMRAEKIISLKAQRAQLGEAKREQEHLLTEKEQLQKLLKEKTGGRDDILSRILALREGSEEHASKLATLEDRIEELARELSNLMVSVKAERETLGLLEEQLQSYESRRAEFEKGLNTITTGLKMYKEMKIKDERRLEVLREIVDRNKQQRVLTETEIKRSEKILKDTRISIKEFESRRDLANSVLSEEKALEHIETLASMGALGGVQGRLGEKIKIPPKYRKAVDASAEGWLQALIVDDMDAVRRCAESLRRAKIGRVKLLPLSTLKDVKAIEKSAELGAADVASNIVECSAALRPAVNFVLGDTLIAANEEAALNASAKGHRAVTLDGEVYEPGPRLWVGFYREPIDISDVIPSDLAIKRIDETIDAFGKFLERRTTDLKRLEVEVGKHEEEREGVKKTLQDIAVQMDTLRQNADRTHKNIVELNRRIRSHHLRVEKSRESIASSERRMKEVEEILTGLRVEAGLLKRKLKPENITHLDGEKAALETEINNLQMQINKIEGRFSTLDANIKNIQEPSLQTIRGELIRLRGQIRRFHSETRRAAVKLEDATKRMKEADSEKERLSNLMMAKREEIKKFTSTTEEIDHRVKAIDRELDPLEGRIDTLKGQTMKSQMDLDRLNGDLKRLGYDAPIPPSDDQPALSELDSRIERVKEEYGELEGKLNMNAPEAYEQTREKYRVLATHINKLEEERRHIQAFMDAIEKEKREKFIAAFNTVAQKFQESFHAMTTGQGWLQLQNIEDPFAGGIDIIVEFPGKPQMILVGTSGGEMSVAAICYIFAMQSLARSVPFYIFDEVDAHLDPVNVQRLAMLLQRESEQSQIIAITFKEMVATKASHIYGVFSRDGITYVYSMPQKHEGVAVSH